MDGKGVILGEDGQVGKERADIEVEKNKYLKVKSYCGSSQDARFNLTL